MTNKIRVIQNSMARRVDEVMTTKGLKALRTEQFVIDFRDFVNWIDVSPSLSLEELRYGLWNLLEVVPEEGAFKKLRLDWIALTAFNIRYVTCE